MRKHNSTINRTPAGYLGGSRRAKRQQAQRQRRAQRELQQALRERAEQDAAPRNDPPLLPRID